MTSVITSCTLNRRRMIASVAGVVASLAAPRIVRARPFEGVKIRGLSYQHRFFGILQGYIPEFERATGISVDLQLLPFPQYNQEVGRQLKMEMSSLDFINVTFFLAAQWVAAGYLCNLDRFTQDQDATPPGWNAADFVAGAQLPYRDQAGATYGYAWEGGAMVMGLSRMDVMERRGLRMPQTFDELAHVCAEIDAKGEIAGFVSWHLHHWCLIPYLQGMGGDVFKKPPHDVTPTLDTPEAARALELYAKLMSCAPKEARGFTEEQARQSFITGRANLFIHSSSWVTPALTSDESRVRATTRIARMPAGPLSDRPASNSQGLGIPSNSGNKRAAWEFVKWALSPEMCERMVREHGHATVCRRSVITSDTYRRKNTIAGQDLGALYLDVLELPARGENYMAYRTTKEFPLVGAAINRAVDAVLDRRMSAAEALQLTQTEATTALHQAQ